jgi:acid stress-induced BolA-like protein IbaG/YrbA
VVNFGEPEFESVFQKTMEGLSLNKAKVVTDDFADKEKIKDKKIIYIPLWK